MCTKKKHPSCVQQSASLAQFSAHHAGRVVSMYALCLRLVFKFQGFRKCPSDSDPEQAVMIKQVSGLHWVVQNSRCNYSSISRLINYCTICKWTLKMVSEAFRSWPTSLHPWCLFLGQMGSCSLHILGEAAQISLLLALLGASAELHRKAVVCMSSIFVCDILGGNSAAFSQGLTAFPIVLKVTFRWEYRQLGGGCGLSGILSMQHTIHPLMCLCVISWGFMYCPLAEFCATQLTGVVMWKTNRF